MLITLCVFFSKKFDKHQVHYRTRCCEPYSTFYYIYVGSNSAPVQVFSDHNPLVFLSHMHKSRFMFVLNVEVLHVKGTDNTVADALSRVGV